jgi:hypothetical protein
MGVADYGLVEADHHEDSAQSFCPACHSHGYLSIMANATPCSISLPDYEALSDCSWVNKMML